MLAVIEALHEEHGLIEAALGALRSHVEARVRGEGDPADGPRFVAFFRVFAGAFHHEREEHVLFPALVEKVGLPGDVGPIAAILAQHVEMAGVLGELERAVGSGTPSGEAARAAESAAVRYSRALWSHIDAENSVLLPEADQRLRLAGVLELAGRAPTDAELASRREGERLVASYPPYVDLEAMRGEGCVVCSSFGTICEGVERTWWNESEWEELPDRVGW